jgi:uncharacterized surface protein with fasciclin (FAS1) repeats
MEGTIMRTSNPKAPRRRRAAGLVAAAAVGLASVATAPTATAGTNGTDAERQAPGNRSLARVLAADGTSFDKKARDFDIVEAAVVAVLEAKPDSPVGLLTKGRQRLTAFIPTDAAFRTLAADLTGQSYHRERRVFNELAAAAGIDTIEAVLLYHVVPGRTLGSGKVVDAAEERAELTMASGGTVRVKLNRGKVVLVDADTDDRNPRAIGRLLDINKGNKQIAHGIDRVLRPIDL